MEIGKPKRKYTIEPIRDPVRRGRPAEQPAPPPAQPVRAPEQPVRTGAR